MKALRVFTKNSFIIVIHRSFQHLLINLLAKTSFFIGYNCQNNINACYIYLLIPSVQMYQKDNDRYNV